MLVVYRLSGVRECAVDPWDWPGKEKVVDGLTELLAARLLVGRQTLRLLHEDGQALQPTWTWAACSHAAAARGELHLQLVVQAFRPGGGPELCTAIETHNVAEVRSLLRGLVDPNVAVGYRPYTSSPLCIAAYSSQSCNCVAQALLDARADIDGQNFAVPPLAAACSRRKLRVAEFLLLRGADVNSRTSWGETPLHIAATAGHVPSVRLLLRHGADVSARDLRGCRCLDDALARNRLSVAQRLTRGGARVGHRLHATVLLHKAARHGSLAWVKVLVSAGACRRRTDRRGRRAADVALRLPSFRRRFQLRRLLRPP